MLSCEISTNTIEGFFSTFEMKEAANWGGILLSSLVCRHLQRSHFA